MTLASLAVCLVVGIADGDTLTARCGEPGAYEQVKVRIAQIDSPERRQPFGERSRQSLAALCFQQTATIRTETRDRYRRTVARVECRGVDASLHQVQTGMAWHYVRYSKDERLRDAEALARVGRVGLWAELGTAVQPVAPWEWRRQPKGPGA